MTIALDIRATPEWLRTSVETLQKHDFAVVSSGTLKALEEAKDRYERFYLDHEKLHPTIESRAQRSSEAVAQHEEKQSPCLRPGDLNTHADIAPCTLHAENTFLLNELKTLSSAYARIIAFCQSNA
jgi:hypothetical protein